MEKGTTGSLIHQPESQPTGIGGKEIELQVRVIPPKDCPRCGNLGLHRQGTVPKRRLLDVLLGGRWVHVSWTPLRLRCPRCKKTFLYRPAGVRPWSRFTDRATRTICSHRRNWQEPTLPGPSQPSAPRQSGLATPSLRLTGEDNCGICTRVTPHKDL